MNNELKQEMTERFNTVYGEEVKIGLREALRKVYIDGGEYGYQYAIDKACEWIETHLLHAEADGYMTIDLFKQFRKAMED